MISTPSGWADIAFLLALYGGSFLIAYLAVGALRPWLVKRDIQAAPDARSMHKVPVPVGGGLVVIGLSLAGFLLVNDASPDMENRAVLSGALILALISWRDDVRPMHFSIRLIAQSLAVALVLLTLPSDVQIFPSFWPAWLERMMIALGWVWFINLFNFMDGIDGLAASEIIFICAGFIAVGVITRLPMAPVQIGLVLAGATSGFLIWNWERAKIMLGDVGAIPAGFLLGWLLLKLALHGYPAVALLLPGYFLVDATSTLLRRMMRGEKFLQPHRTHAYQKAASALDSHAAIVLRISAFNLVLLVCALAAMYAPLTGLLIGSVVTVLFTIYLHRLRG